MRGPGRWIAGGLLACALAACSSDQAPPPDVSSLVVDRSPVAGQALDQQASGPMTLETATTATPMDPTQFAQVLSAAHFQTAYSRVWQAGSAYTTALLYALADQRSAAAVVDAQRRYLSTALGVVISPDPAIAGAWTYVLYGNTRVGSRGVFCQGEWLTVSRYASLLTTCADHPGDVTTVRGLASLEDARLLAATGATPAPPTDPSAAPPT